MASPTSVAATTPIAELSPILDPDKSSVAGVVTLIWPYASSEKSFSLLLVEPDFRLRSNQGQVRVRFQGSSAKAIARSGVCSGDQLLLSLRGAQWAKDSKTARTPGRGIDWELQFGERLVLQIHRPSQHPVPLDIDHPTPSPQPSPQTLTPISSPRHGSHFATAIERPLLNTQLWASPAFLKRKFSIARDYDPFVEEEFPDNDRKKRTRFGRGSGQWRFAERTSSPEQKPENPAHDDSIPSRVTAQDRRGREEVLSGVGPPDKYQSIDDDEWKGQPIPVNQVNDGKNLTSEVTEDEDIEDLAITMPPIPYAETGFQEIEIEEGGRKLDSSSTRPISPISQIDKVSEEVYQRTAQFAQVLPPPYVEEKLSPFSSTVETDQESATELERQADDASHHEPDSLFDEQSEFGQSTTAMYSDPTSDFGVDGSTFSRPSPLVEPALPLGAIQRPEEGIEADGLNTEDAQSIPPPLKNPAEQSDSEPEVPSISDDPATELLLADEKGSGDINNIAEAHDAAQRRASGQMPSSDRLGSPEVEELDDETMKVHAAAQSFTHDQDALEVVDSCHEVGNVKQSSSDPPSSPSQIESQEFQEAFLQGSQEIIGAQVLLGPIPEESTVVVTKQEFLSSSQEKEEILGVSNEEDASKTRPETSLPDPDARQQSPTTLPQESALNAKLFSLYDSKTGPSQRIEVRDCAESVGTLPSTISKPTVEIIDLESCEESDISPHSFGREGLQSLVDPTNGYQKSTSETYRPSTLLDSTRLTPKPAAALDDLQIKDVRGEPEANQEGFGPEEDGSRKQSLVAAMERYQEEVSSAEEASSQWSQEVSLTSKERAPKFIDEPRFKQLPTAKMKLEPTPTDELPSTVPDSFEGNPVNSQLLTPSSPQPTNIVFRPISTFHSTPEDDTLPTPQLTQSNSAEIGTPQLLAPPEDPILAEKPAPPKKTSALIERLKEMRRLSNQSPKPRSSDARALDPWFAPKQLSQMIPDSEDESGAEGSPEREAQADVPVVASQLPQTPEKPLAKLFIRSPSQPAHISSTQSSPQYLPPSQPPLPGFRTKLSYFVPLASLPSHFATAVDILAIALSSTPVTQANSGPRDYNQTLYFTDPSTLALEHPITTAQIFRPSNGCFPLTEKGDALLLRNFKVQSFQRHLSLLSTESSAWAVFRKGADVQMRGTQVEFGAEERAFARGLWDWWISVGSDARKRVGDAVPEYKKPKDLAITTKYKAGGNNGNASIKKEEIEGLGLDLPGSQSKRRQSMKERSLNLYGEQERDMAHESIEAPKRVLRARGAKGTNGRSESARESRHGTVFIGGLGEPDETQGSAHELRDGKAYRKKGR